MEDREYLLSLEKDCLDWKAYESFTTLEEAVKAGKLAIEAINQGKDYVNGLDMHVEDIFGALPRQGTSKFYVGQFYQAVIGVDVDNLLENIDEQLYSEYGESMGDYSVTDELSEEEVRELEEHIYSWLGHNLDHHPQFGNIENVQEIKIGE